jgi:hypothetical protein
MGEDEHPQDQQTKSGGEIPKPVEPFHDPAPSFHDLFPVLHHSPIRDH